MKRETQEAIQDALAWAVSTPMYISWRSNQPFPGAGERKSRRRGPTIPDFATHKNWEPGDDTSNIDWVASAQTNMEELVLRLYHEPRDINVVVVADSGPTMRFGSTEVTKHQFAARIAASILVSAEKTHDLVGMIAFPDLDQKYLVAPRPAKSVLRSVLQNLIECGEMPDIEPFAQPLKQSIISMLPGGTERLAQVKPAAPRRLRGSRSINALADALTRLPRARSLVFVISDFLNLSEADKDALARAARTHYIVCLGVYDIRERELPGGFGLYTLRDVTTGETQSIWLNQANRNRYRENFQALQKSLNEFFTEAKIHFHAFSTEDSPVAQQAIRELFWIYR